MKEAWRLTAATKSTENFGAILTPLLPKGGTENLGSSRRVLIRKANRLTGKALNNLKSH